MLITTLTILCAYEVAKLKQTNYIIPADLYDLVENCKVLAERNFGINIFLDKNNSSVITYYFKCMGSHNIKIIKSLHNIIKYINDDILSINLMCVYTYRGYERRFIQYSVNMETRIYTLHAPGIGDEDEEY
jgi:hypothetical protein